MPAAWLLDTNILVHLVRRDALGERIQNDYSPLLEDPRPQISVVTDGELRSLGFQFGWGAAKTEQARFFLNYFRRVSIDADDILNAYPLVDAYCARVGQSMGKNDLWIAATAHVTGATILTID